MFGAPNEDGALFAFVNSRKDVQQNYRYIVEIKDCWGDDLKGYSCQLFGVDLEESGDPDSYPYWRIILPDPKKANTIVHLLRYRICFEPQTANYPLYLEVRFLASGGFSKFDISIRGFNYYNSHEESWLADRAKFESDITRRRELVGELCKLAKGRIRAIAQIDRARELMFMAETLALRSPSKNRGPRRKRTYLQTDEELKDFSRTVDELRSVWGKIKKWFVKEEYDGGSVKAIQTLDWFQELSNQHGEIPESVLKLVMARRDLKGRKNWPYAFALEHARIIFKIKPLGFDRLDEVYKDAKKT
jgi:hypothetical protein